MSVAAGTRLGPYEIVAPLGAGGMGEVYKATDTRLDRTVAIKVLSGHLAADPDLRERFDREARAISSLNHPNICGLYDVGHQDGIDYLVMEFLQGESLWDRVRKGPLPLADVVRYGIEIASALDRAHREGIVHRDLKPGNIIITKAGAKLLDFGLAKRQATGAADVTALATRPPDLTARGSILGTFQYMAPEQLEGADADARSDIFALGAVLYEMATGRKAFEGKTQASLIAAILEREPPALTTILPVAPAGLERIIRIALAKDPDERWQTARDVVRELKELSASLSLSMSSTAGAPQTVVGAPAAVRGSSASSSSRERIAWGVALAGIALAAFAGWRLRQGATESTPPELTRFTFTAPPKMQFVSNTILSVSPNGRYVVFLAGESANAVTAKLWLRSLDATEAVPIAGTEGAGVPFWSPDSRFIGFFADGKLKKLSLTGGPPQELCDAPTQGANRGGGSWSVNDVIVFQPSNNGPLFRVSGAGGVAVAATKLDEARKEIAHRYPSFLPDGKHFVYVAQPGGSIVVGALDSDLHKIILQSDSKPEFAPPDHLLFVRQTSLMTQRLDPVRLELVGDAVPVGQGIRVNPSFGSAAFSASANGMLAFGGGNSTTVSRLEWIDRSGGTSLALDGMFDYRSLAVSPDGRRVVAHRHEGVNGANNSGGGGLWTIDLDRGVTSRFTLTSAHEENPVWSPDGLKIAFASFRDGQPVAIYARSANGTGAEELLLKEAFDVRPTDWSPDGKWLAYIATNPKTGDDVYVLPLTGDRTPKAIATTAFGESAARFSPDGRFIAYHSTESRRVEVYVQSLGADGGRWQVSTTTGIYPLWRRDGGELFYLSANDASVLSVPFDPRSATPIVGAPKQLFKSRIAATTAGLTYAVSADGKRFLAASALELDAATLTVVLNWTAGLKKEK